MKEIIETSKGRFVVLNLESFGEWGFSWFSNYGSLASNEKTGESFKYEDCFKLSEITESDASSIVDESFNAYNEHSFVYYRYYVFSGCYIVTAIQSLHSLLESKGIEITNNTYIFKV